MFFEFVLYFLLLHLFDLFLEPNWHFALEMDSIVRNYFIGSNESSGSRLLDFVSSTGGLFFPH